MGNRKIPSTVLLGSILLLVIILLVIAAPLFTSYAPDEAIAERLQEFSFSHPFGTDRYGRDIFCRTLYGGRTTLTACFLALVMALFIGTFFGIITGMRSRGLLDYRCPDGVSLHGVCYGVCRAVGHWVGQFTYCSSRSLVGSVCETGKKHRSSGKE